MHLFDPCAPDDTSLPDRARRRALRLRAPRPLRRGLGRSLGPNWATYGKSPEIVVVPDASASMSSPRTPRTERPSCCASTLMAPATPGTSSRCSSHRHSTASWDSRGRRGQSLHRERRGRAGDHARVPGTRRVPQRHRPCREARPRWRAPVGRRPRPRPRADRTAPELLINPMTAATSRLSGATDVFALVHGINTDPDGQGVRHQKALTTHLDASTGEVTRTASIWVSYPFDQRMIFDGQGFVELHLGDAYPRDLSSPASLRTAALSSPPRQGHDRRQQHLQPPRRDRADRGTGPSLRLPHALLHREQRQSGGRDQRPPQPRPRPRSSELRDRRPGHRRTSTRTTPTRSPSPSTVPSARTSCSGSRTTTTPATTTPSAQSS